MIPPPWCFASFGAPPSAPASGRRRAAQPLDVLAAHRDLELEAAQAVLEHAELALLGAELALAAGLADRRDAPLELVELALGGLRRGGDLGQRLLEQRQ